MATFEKWVADFSEFVGKKGKVPPGKYRAYGYKAPTHLWKEAKTGIRAWMLRLGITPENSSNEAQKKMDLNQDTTMFPSKSEGEKLRE